MEKYEYKMEYISDPFFDPSIFQNINEICRKGWRLVSVVGIYGYFVRPIICTNSVGEI